LPDGMIWQSGKGALRFRRMNQTAPIDVGGIFEIALDDLLVLLDRAAASADVRALRTEAARLRRAVDEWKVRTPGRRQLVAMHEVLAELSERAHRVARPISGFAPNPNQRPTIPEIPAAR